MQPSRLTQTLALTCSLLLLTAFIAYRSHLLDSFISSQQTMPFSDEPIQDEWPVTETDTPEVSPPTILPSSKSIILATPEKKLAFSLDSAKKVAIPLNERMILSSSKSGIIFPPKIKKGSVQKKQHKKDTTSIHPKK